MTEKYELTGETKEHEGHVLHRIRALRDIPKHGIKKGDLGGWIEMSYNLSNYGDSWIGEEAMVFQSGRVMENAFVCGAARVSGGAQVRGGSEVSDEAQVFGHATVWGYACVCDHAKVSGDASVSGMAQVWGDARVEGEAHVTGEADIVDLALVKTDRDFIVVSDGLLHSPITVYRTVDGTLRWAFRTLTMPGFEFIEWARRSTTADVAARLELYVNMCEKAI